MNSYGQEVQSNLERFELKKTVHQYLCDHGYDSLTGRTRASEIVIKSFQEGIAFAEGDLLIDHVERMFRSDRNGKAHPRPSDVIGSAASFLKIDRVYYNKIQSGRRKRERQVPQKVRDTIREQLRDAAPELPPFAEEYIGFSSAAARLRCELDGDQDDDIPPLTPLWTLCICHA